MSAASNLPEQPRNRWAEKQALTRKVQVFYNQSSRAAYPKRLELTPDEQAIIGTRRGDLTPERAKTLLNTGTLSYNPVKWYELVWPDQNKPPVLLITNFYLQPTIITEMRITGNEHPDRRMYAYEAQEFQLICDRMMSRLTR